MSYLPRLLEKLDELYKDDKAQRKEVHKFYKIFDKPISINLISMFVRPIPKKHVYYHRIGRELHLIIEKDFLKVFLQVKEILNLAGDIPHIIRGSAGSSVICYLLGITEIDPIKYNISLARFMHEGRGEGDWPDVDIDFPSNHRAEIYDRIFKRWEGKVARISNHVYYKKKSALKEAIRRNGYRKFIPKDFDLDKIFPDMEVRNNVLVEAENIKNTFRCYSLHVGAIVIWDYEVPKELYLKEFKIIGEKTGIQIKLNKDETEDMNFIKIDVLSNRGLSQLWDISKVPLINYVEDPNVYKLLGDGNNIGITYAESRGLSKLLKEINPKNLEEIGLVLALIRPAASSQKSEYIKECEFFIPESHYKDFIIYDDDAILYISDLLRIDEGNADLYRKAFAKNKKWEKIKFEKELRRKHPHKDNEEIVLIMQRLSNLEEYSFCKSHSISYAQLVYALAYQKFHNPHLFWCSTLNNCQGSTYRKWVHYREAQYSGLILTLGKPPFRIVNNKLTSETNIQKLVYKPVNDYFQHGYWINGSFLPNMYYRTNNIRKKQFDKEIKKYVYIDIQEAQFRGLIAVHRVYLPPRIHKGKTEAIPYIKDEKVKKAITFVTLGYDNGKFIDIVLWGAHKLSKSHCIEGIGIVFMGKSSWISVQKYKLSFMTD